MIKVSWSGGKDSTAAALMRIDRQDELFIVNYMPMLTDSIPLVLKCHYEYIMETIEYFKAYGVDVYQVHGMTYQEYCTHYAFPCVNTRFCSFRDRSKLVALNSLTIPYDMVDIGLAVDETKRTHLLTGNKCSILYDEQMTEYDAKMFVKKRYKLSPLYSFGTRDGCIICPNGKQEIFRMWLKDYPQAIPIIKEIQEHQNAKNHYPLRGYKNFI